MDTTKLDHIRRAALDSAEAGNRLWKRVITLFALVEGTCWLAYVLLAYYGFPTSWLIAVATLLVYSTLFTSVMGVRLHLDQCTQRILKAMESLAPDPADRVEAQQRNRGDSPPSGGR